MGKQDRHQSKKQDFIVGHLMGIQLVLRRKEGRKKENSVNRVKKFVSEKA